MGISNWMSIEWIIFSTFSLTDKVFFVWSRTTTRVWIPWVQMRFWAISMGTLKARSSNSLEAAKKIPFTFMSKGLS